LAGFLFGQEVTMKRALLLGPSILMLACAPLSGQQRSNAATRDIRALYQSYMEAFNKKDVAKIMSYYVPGSDLFVFDVTPPRQHVGWADYKKDWDDLFAAFTGPVHQELSDLNVTTVGTLAVSHYMVAGYFTGADGTRLTVAVRVTDALRRMHGKWLIFHEHASVPVDLATAKADLLSKP
jgi:ketosteroid isomerase-like protein